MPSVEIQRVSVAEVWQDLALLMQQNNDETGAWRDLRLGPSLDMYQSLENEGKYLAFVACLDLQLVGYAGFFVAKHLHNDDSLQATQDAMYVHPDARGIVGVRLIRHTDQAMRQMGIDVVYRQVSSLRDYSAVLVRLGYHEVETTWGRRLIDG